jgi:hypothetical protein
MIIFPRDRDSRRGSAAQLRANVQTASRKRQFRQERIQNITSWARSRGRTRQRERGFYWTERGTSGDERLESRGVFSAEVAGSLFIVWCDGMICERRGGKNESRGVFNVALRRHTTTPHPVTRLLDDRARPAEIRRTVRTSPPSRGSTYEFGDHICNTSSICMDVRSIATY